MMDNVNKMICWKNFSFNFEKRLFYMKNRK